MRSTDPDPLTNPVPWKPFGEKVEKPKPAQPEPTRTGSSGIVKGADGRIRTTHHPLAGKL
jgi:hypothetical protein